MSYEKYYPLIEKANKKFYYFLEKIQNLKSFEEQNKAIESLLEFAVYHNVGIWNSSFIENFYTEYAKSIDIDNYEVDYKKNSFLHVVTTGYSTGGHTRVVERWIRNAPEIQTHSVVFLSPNGEKMSVIENNVKFKKGECIYFDNALSKKEKALKLRELALKYEYIILHTHMEDIIPVIAFGTEKFKRPVLLYNHASLMFWTGKSISDIVLDIVKNDEITSEKRNIKNAFFLGVPSKEIVYSKPDKKAIRKKLSLPADKKVIISSGSLQKYCIINNDSYADTIKQLIDENTYCYIIGIPKDNKYWKKIEKESNGHIVPLGYINFNDGYLDYLSCADLYIDSYPMTGGAAMIDAVSRGVPALSIKTADIQMDYFAASSAYCETKEEFIAKAKKILKEKNYAKSIVKELQQSLEEYQSVISWNKRIFKMLEQVPQIHSVKNLSEEKDVIKPDDLAVLLNIMTDKNALNNKSVLKKIIRQNFKDFIKFGVNYQSAGIPFIIEFLSFKKGNKKTKVVKILGLNLFVN